MRIFARNKRIPLAHRIMLVCMAIVSAYVQLPHLVLESQNGTTMVPAPLSPSRDGPLANDLHPVRDRKRIFKQIIVRCVLQLLLIETTHELLLNREVYDTIPPNQLLRLTAELDNSYQFARAFNADKDLRTGLWRVGKYIQRMESSMAITHPCCRFHETPTKPPQARVEQCGNFGERVGSHVFR